jgi:hypothetical protein
MIALLCFVLAVLASPFKSKSRLEAENAALGASCVAVSGSRTAIAGSLAFQLLTDTVEKGRE